MIFGDHRYIFEMPSIKVKYVLFSGVEQILSP